MTHPLGSTALQRGWSSECAHRSADRIRDCPRDPGQKNSREIAVNPTRVLPASREPQRSRPSPATEGQEGF